MKTLHGSPGLDYVVPLVTTNEPKQGTESRTPRASKNVTSSSASCSASRDITHQVLVDSKLGVTARLHSPSKRTVIKAPPFRCSRTRQQWMRIGQAFGLLIPIAFAVALVTPFYLVAVGAIDQLVLPAINSQNVSAQNVSAQYAIVACVGAWMAATVVISTLLMPFLSPTFGVRTRRTLLPIDVMPSSMHRLFMEMRLILLTLVLCQTSAALVGYFWLSNAAPLRLFSRWQPILFVASCFLMLGVFLLTFGHQAFLHTRGRKIYGWFRQCWRGVALRNFIPEWDNTRRPIFESCRASRRLAAAYRSIKLGATGCFAASGCLAAMTIGDSFLGVIFLVASIAATLTVWPTAARIVNWTKTVVDPIIGHSADD